MNQTDSDQYFTASSFVSGLFILEQLSYCFDIAELSGGISNDVHRAWILSLRGQPADVQFSPGEWVVSLPKRVKFLSNHANMYPGKCLASMFKVKRCYWIFCYQPAASFVQNLLTVNPPAFPPAGLVLPCLRGRMVRII